MKYLLLLLLISSPVLADDWKDKTYFNVGVGYKVHETVIRFDGELWEDPVSARIEVGYQYSRNVRFGISHHSQWRTGFPFNGVDDNEYYKTELFIDYTFTLGDLFK